MGQVGIGIDKTVLSSLGLGSCVGLVIYAPGKKVACLGHIVLPDSSMNMIEANPQEKKVVVTVSDSSVSGIFTNVLLKNQMIARQLSSVELFREMSMQNSLQNRPDLLILENSYLAQMDGPLKSSLCSDSKLLVYSSLLDKGLVTDPSGCGSIFPPLQEGNVMLAVKGVLFSYLLKYADFMIPFMISKLEMLGHQKHALAAKIAGGARMFAAMDSESLRIGEKNVARIKQLLNDSHIPLISESTGGSIGRTVMFDVNKETFTIKTKEGITEI